MILCTFCGDGEARDSICQKCMAEKYIDDVIKHYFYRGYPSDAIVGLLGKREGLYMSERTLERCLRSFRLKKKGNAQIIDDSEIRSVIREEMRDLGSLSGYRGIWNALILRYHIHVTRNLVANIMKEINPVGAEERKSRRLKRRTFVSKGANTSWHIDGNWVVCRHKIVV